MAYMPIRHQLNIKVEKEISNNVYPHYLQMYIVPPSGHIQLEEMQQWCINRLRVLKLVEQVSMQNYKKSSKHCVAILIQELRKNSLYEFANLLSTCDCKSQGETEQCLRRNDCMSHFILRSAFSFEHEKREWFFEQEVKLFRWRFSSLDKESIESFNFINGLQYTTISENEKQKIKEELKMSCCNLKDVNDIKFYKVHFSYVINLIAKRQVFLKDGIAYVPETKISSLILSEFKKKLNGGFVYSRDIASNIHNDERISKIFTILPKCINSQYFKYNEHRQVFNNQLDELSRTSYPLCMRLLHQALKKNHHLTNGGRVQYCLFLKGIGVKADDALQFWRNEFIRKIDEFTFEKKYRYSIRHLYGQEGKRANYEPFSCFKIFNSTIGLRDNHGCPFKHMMCDVLKKTLSKCGLFHFDIESIIQFSKEGFYQEACKRYYEIIHNCIIENTFNHPNIYFNHSRKIFESICSDTED